MRISIYEWMEDFDNWELSTEEIREQLEESVREYNEKYDTTYNPSNMYFNYESRRKNLQD